MESAAWGHFGLPRSPVEVSEQPATCIGPDQRIERKDHMNFWGNLKFFLSQRVTNSMESDRPDENNMTVMSQFVPTRIPSDKPAFSVILWYFQS